VKEDGGNGLEASLQSDTSVRYECGDGRLVEERMAMLCRYRKKVKDVLLWYALVRRDWNSLTSKWESVY
jgi:hypothetical protein